MDKEAYRRNLLWRLADAASKCARNSVEGFELLRQASAHLHRLHPDHVVMTAQELEANFRRPLETWLPDEIRGELTGVLLAPSNAPTRTCTELLLEFNAREQYEQTQQLIRRVRDICKAIPEGDELYRSFREFLVLNGKTTRHPLRVLFQPLDLSVEDLYRQPERHEILAGKMYLCPSCRWPMTITQSHIACPSQWCEHAGSIFDLHRRQVINRLDGNSLKGQVVDDETLVLQDAYWKFTLLPGLLEIQLARGLRVMGFLPTLWPDVDEADVRIDVAGMPLDLDAKVWRYPEALEAHLQPASRGPNRWIVIPDYQARSLPNLRERLGPYIHTYSSCLNELKRRA